MPALDTSVLKRNDRGDAVRQLQLLLNTQLAPPPRLKPDGHFGPRTEQAVIAFQAACELTPDGVVGPQTRKALGLKAVHVPMPRVAVPSGSWMEVAQAELGIHEDSEPGKHNARIVAYHQTTTLRATDDETPWCSSFVNWVMVQAGQRGTNSAAAKSWLDWGRPVEDPKVGAVVVIKKKTAGRDVATGSASGFHVGFFVSREPSHVRILGGNQGNMVKYSNFPLTAYEVKGYRVPN